MLKSAWIYLIFITLFLLMLSGCSEDSFSDLDELLDRDTVSNLEVSVTGALSRPIENANVNTGLSGLMTDYLGKAEFRNMEKGDLEITVCASGYEPVIKRINLDNGLDQKIEIQMNRASKSININNYFPLETGKNSSFESSSVPSVKSHVLVSGSSYSADSRTWELKIQNHKTLFISPGSIFTITGNQEGPFQKGAEIIGFESSTPGQKVVSVYLDSNKNIHRVTWKFESDNETVSTRAGIFKNCLKLKRSEFIQGDSIDSTIRSERIWLAKDVGLIMTENLSEKGIDSIFPENSKIISQQ